MEDQISEKSSNKEELMEFFDSLETNTDSDHGETKRNKATAARMKSIRNIQSSLEMVQKQMSTAIDDQKVLSGEITGDQGVNQRLELLCEEVADSTYSITETLAKQDSVEAKLDLLTGIVIRQSDLIRNLQTQVIDLKTRSMRQNLLFHGIPERSHEDVFKLVYKTMQEDLKIQDSQNLIDVCHRVGPPRVSGSKPRAIVVKFIARRDAEDTLQSYRDLFKRKSHRPTDKSTQDPTFWVTPHYPEEVVERRRYLAEIQKTTKAKTPSVQCKMTLTDLYINNEKYKDPVVTPSARTLLHMDKDETKQINKIKMISGSTQTEKGSSFTAKAKSVSNINEVREVYKKVFKDSPTCSATHNVLVYSLPDGTVGCHDDGETGAGRYLIRWMSKKSTKGVAIVVSRTYGGQHLGFRRFQLIRQAAESALDNIIDS